MNNQEKERLYQIQNVVIDNDELREMYKQAIN